MDYHKKTRKELIAQCKGQNIKGYSGKKKEDIIIILRESCDSTNTLCDSTNTLCDSTNTLNKKQKGQFYTTNSFYILDGFQLPRDIRVVEPFAGAGDLIDWIKQVNCDCVIDSYDIEPKQEYIQKRDTLADPPDYKDAWVITNPPYLARNKSAEKAIYDLYDTNDLYKAFILSVVKQSCLGGIFIIPAGFFFSPRDIDARCRDAFMKNYKITKVKYFEEAVFSDTTTTVVAFSFEKSHEEVYHQNVDWIILPSRTCVTFEMTAKNDWIIGGDIYKLQIPREISVRRYVSGMNLRDGEQQTHITLNALDSGHNEGRIGLSYKKDFVYQAKDCSRTYATFLITGKHLTESEQIEICNEFNVFLEEKRKTTWSLFLPQFRESKEYARKRIPFELTYRIFLHIIYLRTLKQSSENIL